MRPNFLIPFLALVMLSGCAVAPQKKLETALSEGDKAESVVILLPQSEVAVDDVDAANAGGGLIGALIEIGMESTMTKNRQKAISPLRDVLIDFDYEAKLIEAVQSQLPIALVRANAPVKIIRTEAEWREHVRSVIPANVLRISMRYAFEQNFEIAYVVAAVDLSHHHVVPVDPSAPKKGTAKEREAALPKQLHAGTYYSQWATRPSLKRIKRVKGEGRYETDAKRWALDAAEPARDAFARALPEIASLIARDAENTLPPDSDAKGNGVLLAFAYSMPMYQKAPVLERADRRSLVRVANDWFWVDDYQFEE